jgi:hypothetical protein
MKTIYPSQAEGSLPTSSRLFFQNDGSGAQNPKGETPETALTHQSRRGQSAGSHHGFANKSKQLQMIT